MGHCWRLREEESRESQRRRQSAEKDYKEGLAGPFKKLWAVSELGKPPAVKLERCWECTNCGMRIAAINEFKDAAPSPEAILSMPATASNFSKVLYPEGGKGSYVVLKRGRSPSRQYLDCAEFTVAAVHRY